MKTTSSQNNPAFPLLPPAHDRRASRRTKILTTFILTAFAIALTGCATSGSEKQRALVCPQCKMVAVRTVQPAGIYSARGGWAGVPRPTTVYEDQCPGCQGAIKTFFREGKLKHKCSVCKDSPYTCPVFHPLPAS